MVDCPVLEHLLYSRRIITLQSKNSKRKRKFQATSGAFGVHFAYIYIFMHVDAEYIAITGIQLRHYKI